MERMDRILAHRSYREYLDRIGKLEKNRDFCRHDMGHFLDVCRLAWILYLEEEAYGEQLLREAEAARHKELIYGAGLLHDIGRWKQYEEKIPHEAAGKELAKEILRDCDFSDEETELICEAIGNHRNAAIRDEKSLSGLLYRADKMSRACFGCRMEAVCNWEDGKKNKKLLG